MAEKEYEAGVKEYRQTSPGSYLPPKKGGGDGLVAPLFQILIGDCHAYLA